VTVVIVSHWWIDGDCWGFTSLSHLYCTLKINGNTYWSMMGIGGDSLSLQFTLKINGKPHGDADLQIFIL